MKRALFAAAVCLSLALHTTVASQQVRDAATARPVLSGTSSVGGIVVTDETPNRPLRRVTVTLTETGGAIMTRMAISNDTGRFMFRDLPAGRYLITANLPPYLSTAYGAKRVAGPGSVQTGTALVLKDGQQINDVSIRLMKGGVITGVIRDIDGAPAGGAFVQMSYFARSAATGERQLVSYSGLSGGAGVSTDDRGVYRIYGLPPGEYIVSAAFLFGSQNDLVVTTDADVRRAMDVIRRPGSAPATPSLVASTAVPPRKPTVGYVPVFYPGTAFIAQAAPIALGAGEERTGVDFQLQRVTTSRIEGVVIGLDGAPVARVPVRAAINLAGVSQNFAALYGISMGSNVTTDAQGRFVLNGVPPGAYYIQAAVPPAPGGPVALATTELMVQGDDAAVTLTVQPALTVTGRVVFDATAATPPQDLSRIRVVLLASTPFPGMAGVSGIVQANGQVTFAGVMAGRYRLTSTVSPAGPQSPWVLKSATIKGQELLDVPVEIRAGDAINDLVVTFSDRATELSGTMTDASGQPAPEYFIVVFAEDRAYWSPGTRRIVQMRPSRDGAFTFRGLPAGDYRIAAVTDMQQGEWLDPAFLEQLVPASVKVALGANEKKIQDLRVGK